MTPVREAFVLPGIFLTVALLGGLRLGADVRLLPPPLAALVLAMLLVGALARSGVFAPGALMHSARSPLENLCGAVVLATLFAASAQAFNFVLPERGLLHAIFVVFFFVQLLSIDAARTNRAGMLRSLLVLLGSAFLLRFIVLESLYAEDAGVVKRVLTALMSGVTLGGLEYVPHSAATGYVAFFTLALYLVGLVLLPAGVSGTLVRRAPMPAPQPPAVIGLVLLAAFGTAGCTGPSGSAPERTGTVGEAKASEGPSPTPGSAESQRAAERRNEALRRARVWNAPAIPIGNADLGANPSGQDAFAETEDVTCRFVVKPATGTTPKFDCELPGGEIVKVKYGTGNPELHSEVAASRLLLALGFGADRMYIVRRVRCAGCPRFPFHALRCLTESRLERACLPGGLDYNRIIDFDPVVIERRMVGRVIEGVPDQGWAWYELKAIDPAHGGSSRAEVDALRLLAVVLSHWDNKAENQRLVCLPGGDLPDGGCSRPFAFIHDLGAEFGPLKLDILNWGNTPVWADARSCRVSMERLPWGGATFPELQISEEGRQFLLELLTQLSREQVITLFARSRATSQDGVSAEGRSADAWARVFQDKIQQIRRGGPCPAAASLTSSDG